MKTNILVVDDDMRIRQDLKETLSRAGYDISLAEDGMAAVEAVRRNPCDLIISDVRMPRKNGLELLHSVRAANSLTPVILMTAYGTVHDAVAAIKGGAFDYLQKPLDTEALRAAIIRALGQNNGNIIHVSKAVQGLLLNAERVARSEATVLILGESGVGKELVAKHIHRHSERKTGPFVPVNCAALPENLLESELFGYEKGAFTGASFRKPGKFEIADKGTILLDEVTEMDLRLQAKLLRVLQEKEIEVIGSRLPKGIDVRVIATTNRDIRRYVEEGKFREDLFYRLNVFPIVVPPLRDRREDIPVLTNHFLKKFSKGMDVSITDEALESLCSRSWKGNVRELENVIARACILSDYSLIKAVHVRDEEEKKEESRPSSVREMEMKLILDTLDSHEGNRTKAASVLGITVRTLRNKINEYRALGIHVPQGVN